jgi:3-oxoacid CoA-transferase subunit B
LARSDACTLRLTGVGVVHNIIELAYMTVTEEGIRVDELMPGVTIDDLVARTGPRLILDQSLHRAAYRRT